MDIEIWRFVHGNPHYLVSSHGRVQTVAHTTRGKDGRVLRIPERDKKLSVDVKGYQIVGLTKDGRTFRRYVHHLVLEAFVGLRGKGQECRHLDGDPLNNRLDNLAWGSVSENALDRVRHGTHHQASKTYCKRNHELTPDNLLPRQGRRDCRICARERATA